MQKSDAMLQHEKQIAWVLEQNPKQPNNEIMRLEIRNYVIAVAVILFVVIAAMSMSSSIRRAVN
jgi:hypothetical protein